MKKRELLEMIDVLTGVVKRQDERIDTLEKAVNTLLELNPDLVEQDKPKTLDQSVFDGQDEKWRWAAVADNSRAYLFSEEPFLDGYDWIPRGDGCHYSTVNGDYDTSKWQNSLIEREAKPLSGNERIKKLLEKQRFVIVKVSDDSYEDAASGLDIFVCRMIDESGSYPVSTTSEDFWRYAIPIDNNGNEILDVE